MTRPNILWISTHDISPHLAAYAGVYPGADYAITPNLDRLAAEGMRFDQAFAATAPGSYGQRTRPQPRANQPAARQPTANKQRWPGLRSQRRQALRAWKTMCDATPAPVNTELWFKACRLGYSDSREVRLAPAPAG
jgi:hypothetical protein